ncbi:Para-nitrobenzyl esterase [Lasiodiplodia theobromae]|uniref:Para-nitrobenzyl esterase n=1 Tax=Lasiodiplodia theobromae TaxID=45133 RepID=A0A5N5CT97_9PEZI|nr:Para-nitrobenzyl esterase [Lasiodiplodia theobromae]
MAPQTPCGTTTIDIPSFGKVKGLVYPSGTRQFCGIPYATLTKRWTRSVLNTSLPNDYHDGTQHGPICPQPPEYATGDVDPMVPVPPFPHFNKAPEEDELSCLNLNIVLPPPPPTSTTLTAGPLPVMLWIHGGSFLFGSSTHPCYDTVNLSTFSSAIGAPIIAISINYRVGLFGFLASHSIAADLATDGLAGAGNFGLTDQQTALRWVQRYIPSVGGDPDNVTIFGESAGGMSVAQQVWAAEPAPFARAISMSGTLNTIPAWPLAWHERRYRALLEHLGIGGGGEEEEALERLRQVPQDAIAAATCAIEGGMGATANPCADGWYHAQPPSLDNTGGVGIVSPPSWLRSYMVGDVRHEAMIFRGALDDQDYASILGHFSSFMDEKDAVDVLQRYGISAADISHEELECRFEEMATEALFWLQTYLHAHASRVERTYAYHVDQVSTLDNPLKGLAYHAIELLYVFRNLEEEMSEGQRELSRKMAADFVRFAYGEDPWERFNGEGKKWMVYGPDDGWAVKSESDDEDVRRYARMKEILDTGLFPKWAAALDYIVNKRWILGAVVPSKD